MSKKSPPYSTVVEIGDSAKRLALFARNLLEDIEKHQALRGDPFTPISARVLLSALACEVELTKLGLGPDRPFARAMGNYASAAVKLYEELRMLRGFQYMSYERSPSWGVSAKEGIWRFWNPETNDKTLDRNNMPDFSACELRLRFIVKDLEKKTETDNKCDDSPKPIVEFRDDRVFIKGKEIHNKLTYQREKVVKALIKAGKEGLSKDKLVENSGIADAVNVLKRLKDKDDWSGVIHLAGITNGRYRII